ncbi:MAG: DUF349 domain-containing protein [Bacteroidota bacterium]|nr:DUF349 domain-containing protein [Bacteroidota bacterium]
MIIFNPDDSVRDEQFDAENKSAETNVDNKEAQKEAESKTQNKAKVPGKRMHFRVSPPFRQGLTDFHADAAKEIEAKPTDDEDFKARSVKEKKEEKGEAAKKQQGDKEESEKSSEEKSSGEPDELPEVDYTGRSKAELTETLELLIENRPFKEIVDDVDKIKTIFYKKHTAELDIKKKKFLEEGGRPEDYQPADDPLEIKMKELLARFRGKKTEYNKQLEIEKQENLRKKYEIIDKIKDLVNREESINKTFQEFRDLQAQWHSIGIVPQSSLRNLWETYNLNVEIFYDYIKINKELRDLDFKKNMETKIELCEKAEELLFDPNPINAFRTLQEYHQQWRETGPVPRESRAELWDRFKAATSKINKRHHEYFEKQKEEQKKNLEAKTALCEKVEEINKLELHSFKEWETKAREVIQIQKVWRTIGFAPKKHNNTIYQRFREACDTFFQAKRRFYAENKEQQMANLQKKTELCMQAESWQDSTEWKEATDALINLQKEWKEIGSVPRKHSDKIWKRFRKACDHFFERKSEHFAELDSSFEDNLKEKEKLIDELENFEPGDDINAAFEKLKEIQRRWTEIGFVPYKEKDKIGNRYRNALNQQFDRLKIDEEEKAILKYQTKLENIKETPKATRKLRGEREKFLNRIKQLENDIVVWENNIGFFSKSSSAESMIQEVQSKIDNAKKTIEVLEEKINLIDKSGIDT